MLGHLFHTVAAVLRAQYPSLSPTSLSELPVQGFASTTYLVTLPPPDGRTIILQLREHKRPIAMQHLPYARSLLGDLVPEVMDLGECITVEDKRTVWVYTMNRIEGLTLKELLQREDAMKWLPDVAAGIGEMMWKCSTGNGLKRPGPEEWAEFVKRHIARPTETTDPLLLPFHADYVRFLDKIDSTLDLPAEIQNAGLSVYNILVSPEDGTIRGLVDWEQMPEYPIGWGSGIVHALRGAVQDGTYVLRPNTAEVEEKFWGAYLGRREGVDKKLVEKIETAMKLEALFSCTFLGKCNDPERMPRLRMELEYTIPWEY